MKPKAYIYKNPNNDLWLLVERSGATEAQELLDIILEREEDTSEGVAYPILEDEIEAIRDACNEWLKTK